MTNVREAASSLSCKMLIAALAALLFATFAPFGGLAWADEAAVGDDSSTEESGDGALAGEVLGDSGAANSSIAAPEAEAAPATRLARQEQRGEVQLA